MEWIANPRRFIVSNVEKKNEIDITFIIPHRLWQDGGRTKKNWKLVGIKSRKQNRQKTNRIRDWLENLHLAARLKVESKKLDSRMRYRINHLTRRVWEQAKIGTNYRRRASLLVCRLTECSWFVAVITIGHKRWIRTVWTGMALPRTM